QLPDFGTRQFILKNLTRTEEDKYFWKMNIQGIYDNYENISGDHFKANTFGKPTLFLKGEKSNYIRDEDLPKIERLFSDFQLQTIANAGHWVHAENPAAVIDTIENFIDN